MTNPTSFPRVPVNNDWLNGVEHAVFSPQQWATSLLHERMIESARATSVDGSLEQRYGQLLAINQQFCTLLVYQGQRHPSTSVVQAYHQVYDMTATMARELNLSLDPMNDYLMNVAIEHRRTWVLDFLVPHNRRRLNAREGHRHQPEGWHLTHAAALHNFDAIERLMAHGACWLNDGKRVLTDIPCDHPDHPFVDNAGGQARGKAHWWQPLYNDRRAWDVLVRDVIGDEFKAKFGNDLVKAREIMGEASAWTLDLVTQFALGVDQQAERLRPLTLDAIDLPQHQQPSREVMLAELFLNHQKPMTPQSWAALTALGLEPGPAEQEAIMTLRVRTQQTLNDLPSDWTPTAHQGKTLWALLAASIWNVEQQAWNDYGQRWVPHIEVLQAQADAAQVHPATPWLTFQLDRLSDQGSHVHDDVKERVTHVQKTLSPLLAGFEQLHAVFNGPDVDRSVHHARMKKWVNAKMTRKHDKAQQEEERVLRQIDLDAWLDDWQHHQPTPARALRVRPRL